MSGIMPLTRKLGEALDREDVPELPVIDTRVWRPNRESYWPPEVWAEMQRIYAIPDPTAEAAE